MPSLLPLHSPSQYIITLTVFWNSAKNFNKLQGVQNRAARVVGVSQRTRQRSLHSAQQSGGTENAGLEKSGLENVGPNRRGGKDGTGKHGTKFPAVEKAGLENAGPAESSSISTRGVRRCYISSGAVVISSTLHHICTSCRVCVPVDSIWVLVPLCPGAHQAPTQTGTHRRLSE